MSEDNTGGGGVLSARINHLRESTNDTFITSSNIYSFSPRGRSSSSKNSSGGSSDNDTNDDDHVTEEEHFMNSIRLVVNHLELAALITMRYEPDAVVCVYVYL